jgi:hypothetical protein
MLIHIFNFLFFKSRRKEKLFLVREAVIFAGLMEKA